MIDMIRTSAPETPSLRRCFASALQSLAHSDLLGGAIAGHDPHGSCNDRELASRWLATRLGEAVDTDRVLLTNSSESALIVLFQALASADRVILSEALSYMPVERVCGWLKLRNHAVEIDENGLIPEAFEAACRDLSAAVLYCNPTIHNPTTSMLPLERRIAIAHIARKYGVTIIEDDVHGKIAETPPPPIASLAPDIAWYLMPLSKCVGFGLRETLLVGPSPQAVDEIVRQAAGFSGWYAPGVSLRLVSHLFQTGEITVIEEEIRREIRRRGEILSMVLGGLEGLRTQPGSMHAWLELEKGSDQDWIVAAAAAHNVKLRHSRFYQTRERPQTPTGIRISIVAPKTHAELRQGLEVISEIIREPGRFRPTGGEA